MHGLKRRLATISDRITTLPMWRWLGPLSPLVVFAAFFLLLFALGRIALAWDHWSQVSATQELWRGLLSGARVDAIVIADALALPTLIALLVPHRASTFLRPFFAVYFSVFGAVFLFFEIASWPFFAEFQSRPNHLMLMYLSHPAEIVSMVLGNFAFVTLLGTALILGAGYALFRAMRYLVARATPWSWRSRLIALPFTLGILFVSARSGLGEANANPSLAAFSNNFVANQLALNATYSVAFAAWVQHDDAINVRSHHGDMPRTEILKRIRDDTGIDTDRYTDAQRPTLHTQNDGTAVIHYPNIVIIVEESLGARMIGALGGKPVSPRFDELTQQGIFFTRLYATGERTYRGLESVTAGYPPIDHGTSVMRQPMAQRDFFTLGALLKQHGYRNTFVYGGEGHFDNMAGFFLANGFDRVIDRQDFRSPQYNGTWGVSDEDLFNKLDELLNNSGNEPAFVMALTLSNHRPFDFPPGKIDLYEQPAATTFNSAKYADYALGQFFDRARTQSYFQNSLFLVVADHQWRIEGDGPFPINEYHIPALILGGKIQPRRIDTLASQIDLPVTLLGAVGFEVEHPMIGRDLLRDHRPGRALMEHGDGYAYWSGHHVVVLPSYRPPQQYAFLDGSLREEALDNELYRNALAQVLVGDLLYREKAYSLPVRSGDACELKPKK